MIWDIAFVSVFGIDAYCVNDRLCFFLFELLWDTLDCVILLRFQICTRQMETDQPYWCFEHTGE